jgi:hypothetical protein
MNAKKTIKQLLIDLDACEVARVWAEGKTIEQIVEQCHRGDWLLWLADKVCIGLRPLILAKGHCANTVRHLMKDERSVKAVDTAIAFGEGKATEEELNTARDAAWAAAWDADWAAAWDADSAAALAAARAADASADAARAADASADAVWVAAWDADSAAANAADADDDADSVESQNLLQTADICREYIGDMIIQKCNELMNN